MQMSIPTKAEQVAAARSSGVLDRSLDFFNLFVANIQTGFGPFIAVYLTSQNWTQTEIGIALSVGTVTAMASQVPAGALVDAMSNKTRIAALSVLSFTAAALCFAIKPIQLLVYLGEILHGFSGCTLGPSIAAMSLAVAGSRRMGERLGRNSRFGSIGNGIGAALMGACGYYISERSVMFLTAVLTLPALLALAPLGRHGRAPLPSLAPVEQPLQGWGLFRLMGDRGVLVLCLCAMLFTFGNAPMLTLVGTSLTKSLGHSASLVIAACIVLPQLIMALLSPRVGRLAQSWGRRPLLLVGFTALPIRGALLAITSHPVLIVLIQGLDGIAAACFGILTTLIISDITTRTGHFTLTLGVLGLAVGVGGTFSSSATGWVADHYGTYAAFTSLATVGLGALLLAYVAMPETRPEGPSDRIDHIGPPGRAEEQPA